MTFQYERVELLEHELAETKTLLQRPTPIPLSDEPYQPLLSYYFPKLWRGYKDKHETP
jgi:hypothetical protein